MDELVDLNFWNIVNIFLFNNLSSFYKLYQFIRCFHFFEGWIKFKVHPEHFFKMSLYSSPSCFKNGYGGHLCLCLITFLRLGNEWGGTYWLNVRSNVRNSKTWNKLYPWFSFPPFLPLPPPPPPSPPLRSLPLPRVAHRWESPCQPLGAV